VKGLQRSLRLTEKGGNGVHLTGLSGEAPMLDMRGNGFAVHTGWVGA
jgi:hypothetical protein